MMTMIRFISVVTHTHRHTDTQTQTHTQTDRQTLTDTDTHTHPFNGPLSGTIAVFACNVWIKFRHTNQHVRDVICKCRQSVYALKVLLMSSAQPVWHRRSSCKSARRGHWQEPVQWTSRPSAPPDINSHSYSLRPQRQHNFVFATKTDHKNVIIRQIFADIYWSAITRG